MTTDTDTDTVTTATPRVWVGCLACYNAGLLLGRWCDAVDADELHENIAALMGDYPRHDRDNLPHEEYGFFDHEGFGGYRLGEYPGVEKACRIGAAIVEHGDAVAAWIAYDDGNADRVDEFEDHYLGEWESAEAWAEAEWENLGHEGQLDKFKAETFGPYSGMARCLNFDAAQYAHDCDCEGWLHEVKTPDYRVWLFNVSS